ncbi:MAG: TraR/DksA C4-type zinc finger protein [Pseudomonadota bacterium]
MERDTHRQSDADIRSRLQRMLGSAQRRQAKLARHVQHREEPLPADFAEQAVELENEETMVQLAARMEAEIVSIERALQRLEDNAYTRCEVCEEDIEAGRLHALPATTVCIRCAPDGP